MAGEVRLKLFAESPESLKRHRVFEAAGRRLTLVTLRGGSAGPVARFAEVLDRTAAEALRGTTLTVARAALPPAGPDEVYVADLIGREVVTQADEPVGVVVAVENFGAGNIYFGTTCGSVFASRDDGQSWTKLPGTLPRVLSVRAVQH